MDIILRDIDKENWEEAAELKVSKEDEDFVAPNWYSILEAKFGEELYPMGIYDGEKMVGFLMYDLDPDTKRIEMCRMMLDHKFQRRGYGKLAMVKLLKLIKEKYGEIKFYTSIVPGNIGAEKLYESVGFTKTGEIMWDEEVMMVQL